MISLGILFGILSMIFYGTSPVIVRRSLSRINVSSLSFYLHLFVVITLGILVLPLEKTLTLSSHSFLILLATGIVGAIGAYSNYKAYSIQKAPLVSSITSIHPVFAIMLAAYFFQEFPGPMQIIAIFLTILGLMTLNYEHRKGVRLLAGGKYALLTALFWGLFVFLLRFARGIASPLLITFYVELFVFLFVGIPYLAKTTKVSLRQILPLFFAAFCTAMGTYAFNLGLVNGFLYIVAPLSAASPLVTTYLSHFFMGEKLERHQYAAIILSVIGIVLLAL